MSGSNKERGHGMTKILRAPEVTERTGLSRTSLWRREKAGQFPARRRLGPNAVGWVEAEITAWIEARPTVNDPTPAGTAAGTT